MIKPELRRFYFKYNKGLGHGCSPIKSRKSLTNQSVDDGVRRIRHPRCAQIYQHHWLLDTVFKMSVGPEQELRDSVYYRRTLVQKDWDESGLQASLGDRSLDHLVFEMIKNTMRSRIWKSARMGNHDAARDVSDWMSLPKLFMKPN